jgi:ATP-dependent 26S proteasome regulatory subunit
MQVLQVEPNVNTDAKKGRSVRARKDKEGQEAILKIGEVREKIGSLVDLHNAVKDAGTVYGEAVKAVAEKAGLNAAVLRKFVSARAGKKFEKAVRDAEQLSLCFEEIGQ